jgi:tRNA (guanine26-N2/guanine27-N2)-dimethyltransferase
MTDSVQVKEGKANISLPEGAVFYNPAQVFNRDLSIACLRLISKYHHENECKRILKNDPNTNCIPFDQLSAGVRQENGLKIAEALSATGLRSIRYAREIPGMKMKSTKVWIIYFGSLGIDTIYANDIDAGAVESIKKNIELNHVTNLVQASHDDAMNLLYSHRKIDDQFHVVDLDPYGTPAQFLGK